MLQVLHELSLPTLDNFITTLTMYLVDEHEIRRVSDSLRQGLTYMQQIVHAFGWSISCGEPQEG